MNNDQLRQLRLKLLALQLEHRAQKSGLGRMWRERLASPGNLLMAGALGAALGLSGTTGARHQRPEAPPAVEHEKTKATLLGALVAAAGTLGVAQRSMELIRLFRPRIH